MRDLEGKTIVITGASTGIGRVTALELGRRGARMLIATRSEEKTKSLIAEIKGARWIPLDLAELTSVARAADAVRDREEKIDVLIANAGVAGERGATKQGFELAFGTNHLGHFVFVERLLDRMTHPSRVVVVASSAHYAAKSIDWSSLRAPTKTRTGFPEYQVSKLCNVLFSRALAPRAKDRGVHVYAVHPGVIASDLWRSVPWPVRPIIKLAMRTNEQGAASSLFCATSRDVADQTGLYYDANCKVKEPSSLARDDGVRDELWKKSEEWARDYLRT